VRSGRRRRAGWFLGLLPAGLLLAGGVGSSQPGGWRAAWAAEPARTPASPIVDRVVEHGIAVELAITPIGGGSGGSGGEGGGRAAAREGQDVAVRFRVSDAAGQALGGLSPAAWLDRLPAAEVVPPECAARVKELTGGSLFGQAELDLNSYYVLALDEDASINVVDPLFGFGGSKLLTSIPLLSPGEDWALTADRRRLFVSQPEADRVAVIDTGTWTVAAQLAAGRHPTRLALQPDGARLWSVVEAAAGRAEIEESDTIVAIDAREPRPLVVARIATGKGPHDLAFSADSAWVFVTNAAAGTVSVIDARRLQKVADLHTGSRPAAVAYSALAAAAYVADEQDGTVVAIDGRRRTVVARIAGQPGVAVIRFAPGGRLAFVLNPRQDTVQVIDAETNRIVTTGTTRRGPDQVVFSDQLAYIRHRGTDTVLMVPLRGLGEAGHALEAADFTGGQHPLGAGARPSLADGIAPAPDPGTVLVANPADRAIYYYVEGMAAPSGSFHNYGRQPRAVLVVDRGLRERERPGTYETTIRLPRPGRYRIPFFLDAPRIAHCFELEVLPDPELVAARRRSAPVQVEPLLAERRVAVGSSVRLRFRLTDPASGLPVTGVDDLVMMAHTVSGEWQVRVAAREVGDGIYAAEFVPPAAGAYAVIVECRSRHLPFHLSPRLRLDATAAHPPAASRSGPRPDR
jgi:YVTN family beta-propeller protein